MVATFWVLFVVAVLSYILDYRIDMWYSRIIIPSCLIISVASYTKIFCVLSHHQAQVQGFIQQQHNQPNALNMARYKRAVYSALWVQLALVSCYVPIGVSGIVIASSNTYSSNLIVTWGVALVLVYFNSALNPVLYCWRISEMRQAVKQTISQALCCPWINSPLTYTLSILKSWCMKLSKARPLVFVSWKLFSPLTSIWNLRDENKNTIFYLKQIFETYKEWRMKT